MRSTILTNSELRKKIRQLSEKEELEIISRAPLVNEAFSGDFNYSIGEEPIIRRFSQYIPIKKSWSFSIFQPCIRLADFYKEVKNYSRKHTALFEMADVGGIYLSDKRNDSIKIKEKSIKTCYDFLINNIGLNPEDIFINYFSGNNLKALSVNVTENARYIEADKKTFYLWQELGLKKNQLIPDASLRTFVLTFFPFEFYAGYRSEIFIKQEGKAGLIEVGTFQFLDFKTRIDKDGRLKDIEPLDGCFGGFVVGIERLLMAINSLSNIFECDHILPLFDKILRLSKVKDKLSAAILTDAIRLLYAIVLDGGDLGGGKNEKRRYKLKKIIKHGLEASRLLKIDFLKQLPNFLLVASSFQPWSALTEDEFYNLEQIGAVIKKLKER